MAANAQAQQQQQSSPDKQLVLSKFGGMNCQSPRQSIGDEEFWWLENMMPLANGDLVELAAPSAVLATLTGNLLYTQSAIISGTPYIVAFMDTGNGYIINAVNGTVVQMGAAGAFSTTGGMQVTQWSNKGILIIDPAKGYFDWNVTTASTLTNISTTVLGTAIAVYAGRVWIANGRQVTFTGTAGYNDFSAANGSSSFSINDDTLVNNITQLYATGGYMYIFGDESVDVLSNVTIASGVTNFTRLNLLTGVGTSYPESLISLQKTMVMMSSTGIYALLGSTPQKLSDKINTILALADLTKPFTGGIVALNGVLCAAFAFTFNDTLLGLGSRQVIALFAGGKWFLCSPLAGITQIVSVLVNNVPTLYGWVNNQLYPLFSNATGALSITIKTKLYDGEDPLIDKQLIRLGIGADFTQSASSSVTITADNEYDSVAVTGSSSNQLALNNNLGQSLLLLNNSSQALLLNSKGYVFFKFQPDLMGGKYLGMTITASTAALLLTFIAMEFRLGGRW